MPSDSDVLRQVSIQLPELAGYDGACQRLGGLTNRVYRLAEVVVRLPGAGTSEYIDRRAEIDAARRTAAAGLSPEVLYADAESGVIATRWIADADTMSEERFRQRAGSVTRAAAALRRLHTSGIVMLNTFDPFVETNRYAQALATNYATDLPPEYRSTIERVALLGEVLKLGGVPHVPCHCDPLGENLLDDGVRMWLIDWEYCGMSDPVWDLAALAVESHFDGAQTNDLLTCYFGRPATSAERGRLEILRAVCDLLWSVWALVQHAAHNPVEDFATYGRRRLERCNDQLIEPGFAAHVDAVAASIPDYR